MTILDSVRYIAATYHVGANCMQTMHIASVTCLKQSKEWNQLLSDLHKKACE